MTSGARRNSSFSTKAIVATETPMSANVTEALASFAASLQYENVPERVREHCKNLLLDALACAVAGHRGEETQQVAALASALAQSNESTVIGGEALSLAGATILNGYLVTAVTMCDVHRPTLTHVTPEVMPPALAIAERDGASGRDLLVAIAAGCEVTTRIGIGLDYPVFRAKGWHGPGVLGQRWELEQIALRLWPSASSIQGMNTALFDLIERHKIDPAKVKKVRIALSPPAFDLHGKLARYTGKFDALISGHYTAAVILHDQRLTLDQFEPARYDDAAMRRAAAEQIEIRADAALGGVEAVVEMETEGSTLKAHCVDPRGSPADPLSRGDIEGKLRTYADGVLAPSAIAATIDAVGDLENLSSVRKLMQALRAPPRRATLAAARG